MTFSEAFVSFGLALITNIIVMVGAIAFFYWINSSTAPAFVRAHRKALSLVTGWGFMAFLFARMLANMVYGHVYAGFYWTYLNMMILTIYIVTLQLRLRWQAWLTAALIAAYYLGFGAPYTPVGLGAMVVAALAVVIAQAHAERLVAGRLGKYGLLGLLAAAVLGMQAQMHFNATDGWFWTRQLVALAVMAGLCLEFEQVMRLTMHRTNRIQTLTTIDELTGVHNFGTFNKALERRYAAYQKDGAPYTVFEGDLDHFKHINDTYGHPSGNLVLQRLALELESFAETLPFPATAYRLGGEEFAIIAEAAIDHQQAMQIGERFQELLRLVRFPEVDPDLTITCSIGQARVQPSDYNGNDVYAKADRNLYDAKRSGRNRVKAQADDAQ